MENWKKYNDPKYLIALLPGYEIAIRTLQDEMESLRSAISGGRPAIEPAIEPEPAPKPQRRAAPRQLPDIFVQTKREREASNSPAFDSSAMSRMEFVVALLKHYGGKASIEQIRAEALKHPKWSHYGQVKKPSLSVALANATLRAKILRRTAPGKYALVTKK